MANKPDYIAALRSAIHRLHGCGSVHRETVAVHETFQRANRLEGNVEVFDLMQHPKAKRAYVWAHLEGEKDGNTRFVVVLEIPPVKDAKTAVQASIMADKDKGQS